MRKTGGAQLFKASKREARKLSEATTSSGHILIYYADITMLVAWNELRKDFSHFRLYRAMEGAELTDHFVGKGSALRKTWQAELKSITVGTD